MRRSLEKIAFSDEAVYQELDEEGASTGGMIECETCGELVAIATETLNDIDAQAALKGEE